MNDPRFRCSCVLGGALLLAAPLLGACHPDGQGDPDDTPSSNILTLDPAVGGLDTTLGVRFAASWSAFDFEGSQIDFGEGITVDELLVLDAWNIDADITIAADAALGARDVVVESGGYTRTLEDGFTVIQESFSISPDVGMLGETVEVEFTGRNTAWEGGVTWPSFGDGVNIMDFTVITDQLALATLSVAGDTYAGPRDVLMETGAEVVVLYDGFQVDRAGLAASWDPMVIEQGETVAFEVEARGTNFVDGDTELIVMDGGEESNDYAIDRLEVEDATHLYGEITMSNAARTGFRDVLISTSAEGVVIPDAFEVVDGPLDLSEVAVSIAFNITRGIDNSSCQVAESVYALVWFYIPLDPPAAAAAAWARARSPTTSTGSSPTPRAAAAAATTAPRPSPCPPGTMSGSRATSTPSPSTGSRTPPAAWSTTTAST